MGTIWKDDVKPSCEGVPKEEVSGRKLANWGIVYSLQCNNQGRKVSIDQGNMY